MPRVTVLNLKSPVLIDWFSGAISALDVHPDYRNRPVT